MQSTLVSRRILFQLPLNQFCSRKFSSRAIKTIPGKATPNGTKSLSEKTNKSFFNPVSKPDGVLISSIGYGSYRVSSNENHEAATELAVSTGRCNLIDTSSNYTNGESESVIGKALSSVFSRKKVNREDVVVVTKAGYVQGDNLETAKQLKEEGKPFSDMVEVDDSMWHCFSPDFLANQLDTSLSRMKIETVDYFLIHNPEYHLQQNGDQELFYAKLKKAFEYLETEVAKGRIQYYGISSNTFVSPSNQKDHVSLERVLKVAQQVNKNHHFGMVQYPFNLLEAGALLEKNNNNNTESVSEYAKRHQLARLSNRPLNSIDKNGELIKMATFPSHADRDMSKELSEVLNDTIFVENTFPGKDDPDAPSYKNFSWGQIIASKSDELFNDRSHWMNVRNNYITPVLTDALVKLTTQEKYKNWAIQYRMLTARLFHVITEVNEANEYQRLKEVEEVIDEICPEMKKSEGLSWKVYTAILSSGATDCMLLGMRDISYVTEALNEFPVRLPEFKISPDKAKNLFASMKDKTFDLD